MYSFQCSFIKSCFSTNLLPAGKNKIVSVACKEIIRCQMDRVKRIWYLSPIRAAKVQASLRIRAVSPEPSLLAHTSSESRGTFRQKARSLAPLNGWACAVKICHDGMLEDTNSLDGAQIISRLFLDIVVALKFDVIRLKWLRSFSLKFDTKLINTFCYIQKGSWKKNVQKGKQHSDKRNV